MLRAASYIVRSFSPAAMPRMTRPAYRWELLSACFMPLALACVEGGVVGVIAQKSFGAGGQTIAALSAAPALANITSFAWALALRGRDRARAVVVLQLITIACVAAVAAVPRTTTGVVALVALVYAARSCMVGIITARSDLWRANYPRTDRARIAGKISAVMALVVTGASLGAAIAMDSADNPGAMFRILYAAAAAGAVVGAWAFTHVRWRGGAAAARAERREDADAAHAGDGAPPRPASMMRILRDDPTFRRFMSAQFVMGLPNIAAVAPFIIALDEDLGLGYGPAILLTQVTHFAFMLVALPLWARMLDRMHIVRFRVLHSWVFVAANALMGVGILAHSLPILFLSRAVLGAAFGGGQLAWNIGHHDFAPKHLATIYMGVHVTLTGVRGAFAPFAGAALYSGWTLHAAGLDLSWGGMRGWVFFLFAAVSVAGALMFLRLQRTIGAVSAADRA